MHLIIIECVVSFWHLLTSLSCILIGDQPAVADDFLVEENASSCEHGDDLVAGQRTPPRRVQGHSDIVSPVKEYGPFRCIELKSS